MKRLDLTSIQPVEPRLHPHTIEKMHNGLIKCPIARIETLMPELWPIIQEAPLPHRDYVADIKVHMLMPGMYPCIPNWHYDLIPRDKNKNQIWSDVDPSAKMFLWLSGPPFTEFRDGRKVEAQKWIEFTQLDEHRGTPATSFCWRVFIRLAPRSIYEPNKGDKVLRRHSQVYLDAQNFKW